MASRIPARRALPLLLALLTLLAFSCGDGAGTLPAPDSTADFGAPPTADGLPSLSGLPPALASRSASATEYELLATPPILTSPLGAQYAGGNLDLDPSVTGSKAAWGLFALTGFPDDDAFVPVSIRVTLTQPGWLAVADYGRQRWSYVALPFSGTYALPGGPSVLSPDGTFYAALIAYPHAANPTGVLDATSLRLTLGSSLPGDPVAVLRQLNVDGQAAAGLPAVYSAEGSSPGDGAFVDFAYDWGDGSPVETTTDPLTELTHVWDSAGTKQLRLTVRNDQGRAATATFFIEVSEPFSEMLVVYNSDIPESQALAEYYAGARYGRALDPDRLLGLPLGAALQDSVDRSWYEANLRDPLRQHIADEGIEDSLRYILLIKGVPHRINGFEDFDSSDGISSDCAAVDSELCLLMSDYDPAGWIWNGATFQGFGGDGFYTGFADIDRNGDFAHGQHTATWRAPDGSGPVIGYGLDYLVGRIDAYDWADCYSMIDRARQTVGGQGWVVLDSIEARLSLDTMFDPVWPLTDGAADSLFELLGGTGYGLVGDATAVTLEGDVEDGMPELSVANVVGYAGWGVNHGGDGYASGAQYIELDLNFGYLPGAAWISYESFNGTDFDDSNGINRRGQGQIADFLREGGTLAIGNAWEPYTVGVGDERVIFHRYLNRGDRWIEAAYKGLRLLSWMQVVVGDPLCTMEP